MTKGLASKEAGPALWKIERPLLIALSFTRVNSQQCVMDGVQNNEHN
jgi:hypothetical protein